MHTDVYKSDESYNIIITCTDIWLATYLTYTCEISDPLHYPSCHLHMTSMLLCWITWRAYFWVFISILWFPFRLLVISCTYMSDSRHLIVHTCDCLSTPSVFILHTHWVAFWQSCILMTRFWSLDRGGHAVTDQSGAAEACISDCLFGPSFF